VTESALRGAAEVPHPTRWLLRAGRPAARALVRRLFSVTVHGAQNHPSGPAIVAANHIGWADGPLLAIFGPRPVHALTKAEMFTGAMGPFLRYSGQIRLDRFTVDPAAVRACVRVLEADGVVGVFPEGHRGAGDLARFHRGAAYLALVTGSPVVPVTMLGTRAPGAGSSSLPPRGGQVDVVYGAPWSTEAVPWPRTKQQVAASSLALRDHMLTELAAALRLTGRSLPGPLPPGETDDDPNTGVVEQGA
jgi:1-acyl-sn-glycerol-3-phosphate acyltransferase